LRVVSNGSVAAFIKELVLSPLVGEGPTAFTPDGEPQLDISPTGIAASCESDILEPADVDLHGVRPLFVDLARIQRLAVGLQQWSPSAVLGKPALADKISKQRPDPVRRGVRTRLLRPARR
jgi:hypothetical protein